jgi:L-fuculose-phosphate aldolase
MSAEGELRDEIVAVCRRLDARGLVAGMDGNVSARLDATTLLVTPSGLTKGRLAPGDLVAVDLDGQPRSGARRRPSSELRMHLRVYRVRPDVQAVVHAHPPTATGFAVAGEDLVAPVLPEIILQAGAVPLVPYETPGTEALADRLEPYLAEHDVLLLANHGATAVGPSLEVALQRMESLEHAARIVLAARLLGRVTQLTAEQVAPLRAARDAGRRPSS